MGRSSPITGRGKDRLTSAVSKSPYLKPGGKKHRVRRRREHATHDDRTNITTTRSFQDQTTLRRGMALLSTNHFDEIPFAHATQASSHRRRPPNSDVQAAPPSLKARVDKWHSSKDALQCGVRESRGHESLTDMAQMLRAMARAPHPKILLPLYRVGTILETLKRPRAEWPFRGPLGDDASTWHGAVLWAAGTARTGRYSRKELRKPSSSGVVGPGEEAWENVEGGAGRSNSAVAVTGVLGMARSESEVGEGGEARRGRVRRSEGSKQERAVPKRGWPSSQFSRPASRTESWVWRVVMGESGTDNG
ncbi:hypothetical protein CPLU01_11905 [Colletotrichum plurivorum]|uniref:Uncharacterized protein n=1 Tax=Colletotrichum plurivorum TaxID=2175906 RepID=A0A8H6K0Q1_9PEZI|nr:hypothetical protein CPLU01_11905 [Colletotrichum plurivorum]